MNGSHVVHTVDGIRLVTHAVPTTRKGANVAVVVVHGFGSSGSDARVGAVTAALGEAGYATVTYDARGHGASSGETTLGALERHDVAAAVGVARDLAPRIVLVGTSMGGIAVLRHAAEPGDDLAGVVTVSCPARWRLPRNSRGVLAAIMVETRVGRAFARSRMGVRIAPKIDRGAPPVELVRSVRVPLVVIHGTADPFIAGRDAQLIHANAGGRAQLQLVPGLAHAFEPPELVIPPILSSVHWVLER